MESSKRILAVFVNERARQAGHPLVRALQAGGRVEEHVLEDADALLDRLALGVTPVVLK